MTIEMHCYRQLIEITWRHRITVRQKLRDLIGEYEKLLTVARRRILQWFGNISIGIWVRLHMVKEKYYKNADLEDFLSHEFVCNR